MENISHICRCSVFKVTVFYPYVDKYRLDSFSFRRLFAKDLDLISVSISDDKTKNRMTTTDRNQIQTANNTVLSKESYLALMPDDFELICPNPSGMIHLIGKTPKDAISQLKEETDCLQSEEISGVLCFIQSHCLRMRELEEIDKLLPPAVQLKKGLYFDKPEEGDVEIYLFYSIPKSYAFGVNLV